MRSLVQILILAASLIPGVSGWAQLPYSESASYTPRILPVTKGERKEDARSKPTLAGANATRSSNLTIPVGVFANDAIAKARLDIADFKVFIDDKEAEIVSVEVREGPINLILLIDTSPSADVQLKTVKSLAQRIVDKLGPDDKVVVLGFNNELKTYTKLTSDRTEIAKGIKRLQMGDGTGLYNAIAKIAERDLTQINGPTAVLTITDGVDTTSRNATYQSSLVAVERSNTTIFPIYFDTYAANQVRFAGPLRPLFGMNQRGSLAADYELGRSYLTDLTLLSGGRPVRGDNLAPDRMESLDKIPAEIKGRYHVTFRLPADGTPGDRHRIKVRINRPNLTVLAKGSYIDQ